MPFTNFLVCREAYGRLIGYRRLNKPRRGRQVSDTIVACVKSMWIDLGLLTEPVPWDLLGRVSQALLIEVNATMVAAASVSGLN